MPQWDLFYQINNMELTQSEIRELLELSVSSGVIKKTSDNLFAPIKIAYHSFCSSEKVYELVGTISRIWQKLIYKASRDEELIGRAFRHVCCDDPVICKLLELTKKKRIKVEDRKFNFVRNDFFIDAKGVPKLIEYNLDAVSMSGHSENYQKAKKASDSVNSHRYFQNLPNQKFMDAIQTIFLQRKLKGIFLFVVQAGEKNIIELRIIQKGLLERGIKTKMITLEETVKLTSDQERTLKLGEEVVEIVYYRSGYRSEEYVKEWKNLQISMEVIEMSKAIKIPDSALKLFNSKRMQTELSKEEVYTKYLTKEQAELLKMSVIRQWEFDDMPEDKFEALLKEYEGNKQNFILKPNCQGGGNNFWGEEGFETLIKLKPKERSNYILMERIHTKPIQNVLVDGDKHTKTLCDYQISNFGILQGQGQQLTHNEIVGHLIRVKPVTEHEGGILAGVGSLCAWRRTEQ